MDVLLRIRDRQTASLQHHFTALDEVPSCRPEIGGVGPGSQFQRNCTVAEFLDLDDRLWGRIDAFIRLDEIEQICRAF